MSLRKMYWKKSELQKDLRLLFRDDIKFALPEFPVVAASFIAVAAFALYIERSSKNVAMS